MSRVKIAVSNFYVPAEPLRAVYDAHKDIFVPFGVGERLKQATSSDEWVRNRIVMEDSLPENMADKNWTYNECSALYAFWKNLDKFIDADTEWLGLCHYRRRFDPPALAHVLDVENPDAVFSTYAPIGTVGARFGIEGQYRGAHVGSDWELLEGILRESFLHGEKPDVTERWKKCPVLPAPYNCFVMKKQMFQDYCMQMFDALDRIYAKRKDEMAARDNYQKRAMGFLAERFTSWYACQQAARGLKILQTQLVFDEAAKPSDAVDQRGNFS